MKNVDDLIDSAGELAEQGLSKGEIADELNVSRETAQWLVRRAGGATQEPATDPTGPHDVHVNWRPIGQDSARLSHVGAVMADLLSEHGEGVGLTVGIEKAGVPLATAVARHMETDLATYTPRKHQWDEEGDMEDSGGTFSRNFADVAGRDCYVVDDTITSGTTMEETVEAVSAQGGNPVACVVLVDKQGVEAVDGAPVLSPVQVLRVGNDR